MCTTSSGIFKSRASRAELCFFPRCRLMAGLFCFSTKAEQDALAAEIRQRGIRRREFERFITTLESLPDVVTDFSEDLWGSLVEYLTVYAKDDLRFMLPCEVEITA